MISLEERIELIIHAGKVLEEGSDPRIEAAFLKAQGGNQWFTQEYIQQATTGVVSSFTNRDKISTWLKSYEIPSPGNPKTLGLILAGNIPYVGIHDVIAGFISGHHMHIKFSDKDEHLIPLFISFMQDKNPEVGTYIQKRERLNEIDLIVATGSNNTARYFDYYFGKYPNIIRKNRVSVAVLGEKTTRDELELLGEDVFSYFGLGCRNISKMYLPKGYEIEKVMEAFEGWKELIMHNKYMNNFDYNYAIYLLNKTKFYTNGSLITMENESLFSRISCLHFSYYEDVDSLKEELKSKEEDIQCIVSNIDLDEMKTYAFGKGQKPELWDYADNVDTLEFLIKHHG